MLSGYPLSSSPISAEPVSGSSGITFVSSATTINASAGATLVINKPAGTVDGDLMIAVMDAAAAGLTWTGDTGWTEVYDEGASPRLRVAYKVAASEGASYTFTIDDPLAVCGGSILTYRGAAYDVIGSAFTSTGTTPIVAPSITAAGGVLLAIYGKNTASTTFTTPSGMSSVVSNATSPCFNVFSETIAAGATGSRTSTPSTAAGATAGILLSLKAGVPNYTITANSGSYAVTGQVAGVYRNRTLSAAQGSYAVTGQAASVYRNRTLTANAGSYTVTGQAATLQRSKVLSAAQGSYAIAGQAVTILRSKSLSAVQGSYAITGQTATLLRSKSLPAAQGSYAVTGQAATLLRSKSLSADQGSYAVTGQAADVYKGRTLTAAQGSYAVTGQAATIVKATSGYTLTADSGSYTLTGQTVSIVYGSGGRRYFFVT